MATDNAPRCRGLTSRQAWTLNRLWSQVVVMPNSCHEWTGRIVRDGYGSTSVNGKQMRTHRLSWVLTNGPIPDGLHVLHHCDNPPCCNVDHLFLGTDADNMADMIAKGRQRVSFNGVKTHCKHGHEFDLANTYVFPDGRRKCRACRAADARAARKRVGSER